MFRGTPNLTFTRPLMPDLNLNNVLARKAEADRLINRTARDLRDSLQRAVQQLVPFPYFPESGVQAIEAAPGTAAHPDIGCIVLCPDGDLHELTVAVDFNAEFGGGDKREDLREVQLRPQDYIAYAFNALLEVTRLIVEREEGKPKR